MPYIAYLDCHAGINGELLLGALLDAGVTLATLKHTLALLPLQGYDFALEHVANKEIHGTRVIVTSIGQKQNSYTWLKMEKLLTSIPMPIRNTIVAILRHIADAEATLHGEGANYQSFEISIPALITIIGVVVGLKELGITQLYSSALPLTSGHVQTPDGQIPVPTSVTLEILRQTSAIWKPSSIEGEVVTSIGAALLATLARFDTPTMSIKGVGYGIDVTPLARPDGLRLYVGMLQEPNAQAHEGADTDWVTVISTNIDNMSGELLGGLMEHLFDAGALDVSYTPIQMKKNRPATLLMIICPLEKGNDLAYMLLRETTTLGVRMQQVQRLKAQRTQQQIDTPLGPILVKVKRLGSRIISAAPEYEECQRIAQEHAMPLVDVYALAQHWITTAIRPSDETSPA